MKLTHDHPRFDCISNENIKTAIDLADDYFISNGAEECNRTRSRLFLEDVLLQYQKQDETAPFELVLARTFRKVVVIVMVQSRSFNILEAEKDFFIQAGKKIESFEMPTWKYSFKKNIIRFDIPIKMPNRQTLHYVIRYMDSERRAFRRGLLMRFLNMVMLVLEPWFAARIIEAFNASDIRMILTFAVAILAIELGSSLFSFFGTRFLERAYNVMRENMRLDVSGNVLRIKTEHIDANGTGVFTERLIRETANVVDGIDEMVNVVTEAFRLVSLLIAFGAISLSMMVYELILFVAYLSIVLAQSKKANADSRRLFASMEAYSGFIGEMVRAARDIKLLHCENSFLIKLRDIITTCTNRERQSGDRKNKHFLARSQFVAWTDFIYLGILTIMIARHGMSPATALILYNYNGKVFASTRAVAGAADAFNRLLLSSERIYQLMESSDFSRERFGDSTLDAVSEDITLKNVRFSYHHKGYAPVPVIRNMDLHIPAGASVALIGRSGCGKSTVLSLISRLYEPGGGSITLDGADIGTLDQDTIRNNIGMVTQAPYLFSMSLRDNFRLVKGDVTDAQIVEVCKTACVHDDIMKLPDGYDTVIGEGGSMLSGGQRQRIALARALLRDYPVIMLDEATSALDNEIYRKRKGAGLGKTCRAPGKMPGIPPAVCRGGRRVITRAVCRW